MALATQLTSTYNNFHATAPPEVSQTILGVTDDFIKSYNPNAAIHEGEHFPDFELKDAYGKVISLASLTAQGAVLIIFYRGEWCPFCNLELAAFQKHLAEIKEKGVTLVAISPEVPDQAIITQNKNELKFPVLSDVGNELAKKIGILFAQPQSMRSIFDGFGLDWKKRYGDDTYEVPVPATFLVDKTGKVRNAFVDADYTKRLEPTTALEWINAL